jgi:hypothetical protein
VWYGAKRITINLISYVLFSQDLSCENIDSLIMQIPKPVKKPRATSKVNNTTKQQTKKPELPIGYGDSEPGYEIHVINRDKDAKTSTISEKPTKKVHFADQDIDFDESGSVLENHDEITEEEDE